MVALVVACIICWVLGFVCCDLCIGKKREQRMRNNARKLDCYYRLLNQWLFLKQRNISLADTIKKLGYQKVAIYGMNAIGQRLYDELAESDVEIACVIDKNKDAILGEYNILDLNDEFPEVDAVIVTACAYFAEIKKSLDGKVACPILSLEYIMFNGIK